MEYNTTLRINDRLFYDIQEYCHINDLDMKEYLVELIEERHMINKYGDLNEIIPKAIEESKVEVKKRGRPKKKDKETRETSEEKEIQDTKPFEECVKDVEVIEESEKKPTAKRKRTLKTL